MSILVLQEYVRVDHIQEHKDNTATLNFMGSAMGKKLKAKFYEIGIATKDFTTEYVYNKVPEPKKVNPRTKKPISYKDPKLADVKGRFEELTNQIIQDKPAVLIPTGKLGCKFLLGEVSITKLRGVPTEVTLENESGSHTFWVFPMFSMEYITAQPNAEGLYNADLTTLSKYIQEGDVAFKPAMVEYDFLDTVDKVVKAFEFIKRFKPMTAWDLETNTLNPEMLGAKALVISLSWAEKQGLTIPLEHKEFVWSPEDLHTILECIKDFVADPSIPKVGHNIKYDIRFLRSAYGFIEFHGSRDTMVGYYLTVTQKVEKSFKLSDLAYEMTDMGGYDKALDDFKKEYKTQWKKDHPKESLENEIDGGDFNYEWIPLKLLHPYASGDVDCCLRIHNTLNRVIQSNLQWVQLYDVFYPKLISTLATIESNGMKVDMEYLVDIDEKYTAEVDRLEEEIRQDPAVQQLEEENTDLYMAGLKEWTKPKAERDDDVAKLRDRYKKKQVFNPNSPDDKGRVLYDILAIKLPLSKETVKEDALTRGLTEDELSWKDFKADKFALNHIIDNVPEGAALANLLLEHSKVKTLRNNFTTKLRGFVSNKDGNVHGSYNAVGTATSRLSSSRPNMQQVPSSHQNVNRFDYAYPIKRMFVTEFEGGAIAQLDYSALEMRVLGLRASDKGMTQAFLDDKDLHEETARIVWEIPDGEPVAKDKRQAAKSVSFGIVYGESEASLAPKLGVTREEAERIFAKYYEKKPDVKTFIDDTHKFVEENGYVETMQGHRRLLKEIYTDGAGKASALRQSVNTIIQGTGAYLTNTAVILIEDYLRTNKKRSKLIATVHDSIVLDMPPEEIEEVVTVSKYLMENLPIDFLMMEWEGEQVRYPVKADAEIGTTYKDVVEWDAELFKEFNSVKGYTQYFKDLAKFDDYKESSIITPEQKAEGIAVVEAQIDFYKQM